MNGIRNILRALALLRHPEVCRDLGEMRLRRQALAEIRAGFPHARFSDGVEWVGYGRGRLEAGKGVSVCHGTVLAFGDDENGYGVIRIGSGTWVGQYNNLRACGDGDIMVGENCLISQFCTLVGSNHAIGRELPVRMQGPDRSRLAVTLGDDVWLGAGVAVMPGVTIGRGGVVGANSVVTKSVPDYEIWAGAPARKIGERT